jgi:hypothetical protein
LVSWIFFSKKVLHPSTLTASCSIIEHILFTVTEHSIHWILIPGLAVVAIASCWSFLDFLRLIGAVELWATIAYPLQPLRVLNH